MELAGIDVMDVTVNLVNPIVLHPECCRAKKQKLRNAYAVRTKMRLWVKKSERAREEMVMISTIDRHKDNNAIVAQCDPGLVITLLRSEIYSQI